MLGGVLLVGESLTTVSLQWH